MYMYIISLSIKDSFILNDNIQSVPLDIFVIFDSEDPQNVYLILSKVVMIERLQVKLFENIEKRSYCPIISFDFAGSLVARF